LIRSFLQRRGGQAFALLALLALASCGGPKTAHEVFHSALLGRDYSLDIYVPPGAGEELPLVLVLDGGAYFQSVVSDFDEKLRAGEVHAAVIVGIDYAQENLRGTDFTPTAIREFPAGGGLERYVDFIQGELLPSLETRLPITRSPSQRTILGHSLGGLATSYLLWRRPGLFGNLGLLSPSLWYDDGLPLGWEEEYASAHDELPVSVWSSVGAWEHIDILAPYTLFEQRFASRHYRGLRWGTKRYGGLSHVSSAYVSMTDALVFFLGQEGSR
jgi:hypothetical protein